MEKFLLDPKAPGAFSSDVMHKVVDLLPSLSGVPVGNFNDTLTNFVYISDKLKEFYPKTYSRLTKLFNEMDIEWGEIEGTKDIWGTLDGRQ